MTDDLIPKPQFASGEFVCAVCGKSGQEGDRLWGATLYHDDTPAHWACGEREYMGRRFDELRGHYGPQLTTADEWEDPLPSLLRAVAEDMDDNAAGTTPGRWNADDPSLPNAKHIASWDPPVARAVASLLRHFADRFEHAEEVNLVITPGERRHAAFIAMTYLRRI